MNNLTPMQRSARLREDLLEVGAQFNDTVLPLAMPINITLSETSISLSTSENQGVKVMSFGRFKVRKLTVNTGTGTEHEIIDSTVEKSRGPTIEAKTRGQG